MGKDADEKVNCNIVVINKGKIEQNSPGKVRLRGNSSRNQPKKSYQIKFDESVNLLDMPSKAKKWGLLANYMDKTLIRNLVAFKISSMLGQKYTAQCKPVDVIFNGVYDGTYILCDKIEVGKGRVELTDSDDLENEESSSSNEGFLVVIENSWGQEESYKVTTEKGIPMTIKYPDEPEQNQKKYLKDWFDKVERDAYDGVTDNIDIDSFSQYFILEEFCANVDSVWGSNYLTKHVNDEKLYFGPAWDFDLSLDNDRRLYPTNEKPKWVYNYGDSAGTYRDFVAQLMSIENVLDSVKNKWKDSTAEDFTPDKIIEYVNNLVKEIDESQKLNFIRWKILDKVVGFAAEARGSYEAEINQLKDFLEQRFNVFGNMLLSSNTSSFEPQPEKRHGGWGGWGDGSGGFPNWGGNGNWGGWNRGNKDESED